MYLLRTIITLGYLFGYMLVHPFVLRRAEKAREAGDYATVDAITGKHVVRWGRNILKLAGVQLTVEGLENIPKGRACVFVANHRSYFDIPLLLTALDAPHGLLAKQEIDRIPMLRRWMRVLGCVFVARDDVRGSVKALNDATETVQNGRSFVIFPEGTRYKGEEGGMGEFKGGAFRIATKTGAPIVPVAVLGSRGRFEENGNRMKPGRVIVRILQPIETAQMARSEQKLLPEAVAQRIAARLTY